MKTIIKKYNINEIWHFTDRANLDLIKEHGLLSRKTLNDNGIKIPVPGGNELSQKADKRKGLDAYVHLCFLKDHPMQFTAVQDKRMPNPIWLKIDVSVMLAPEVKFTSEVSNKSGIQLLDHSEAVDKLDFEVLFTRMDWKDSVIYKRRQTAEKSEILVPDIIPFKKILRVYRG